MKAYHTSRIVGFVGKFLNPYLSSTFKLRKKFVACRLHDTMHTMPGETEECRFRGHGLRTCCSECGMGLRWLQEDHRNHFGAGLGSQKPRFLQILRTKNRERLTILWLYSDWKCLEAPQETTY